METLPRLQLHQIETIESCTHEVALPPDMEYKPLKPPTGPPAKEYPFILDPFQKESILCLENNESVNIYWYLIESTSVLFPIVYNFGFTSKCLDFISIALSSLL